MLLDISKPDNRLSPGMMGVVQFPGFRFSSGVLVPGKAILVDPGSDTPYVWLIREGKALKVWVRLGEISSRGSEILAPLELNDMVIIEGRSGLEDGTPVKVVGEVLEIKGPEDNGSLHPPG